MIGFRIIVIYLAVIGFRFIVIFFCSGRIPYSFFAVIFNCTNGVSFLTCNCFYSNGWHDISVLEFQCGRFSLDVYSFDSFSFFVIFVRCLDMLENYTSYVFRNYLNSYIVFDYIGFFQFRYLVGINELCQFIW